MGSIKFRIKEVKRDVHVIPIADKTSESNTKNTLESRETYILNKFSTSAGDTILFLTICGGSW